MSSRPTLQPLLALHALRRAAWGAAVVLVMGLSACGGGDGDGTSSAESGGTSACTDPARTLTYSGTAVAGFTNGQKLCFDTASSTTLSFNGTTLTAPAQNTAVSAPFSAWKFTYGTVVLELVLNAGAVHEINVADATRFYGQFSK